MTNIHLLREQPEPAPAIDHAARRDTALKAMRDEYANAQRAEDQAGKDFAQRLSDIETRRRALAEEEVEARRQNAADMASIRDRKLRARAYLDASQEHGIAAE